MKVETREIYKCEHCNKLYQIKRYAQDHELRCTKNKNNNRPCFTCKNLDKKMIDYFDDEYSIETRLSLLYCKAKKTCLYPPKVEIDNKQFILESEPNNPMPKKCKDWKGHNECSDFNALWGLDD